jgi:hypothetical protein
MRSTRNTSQRRSRIWAAATSAQHSPSANTSSNIFSSSNSPGSKKPANHWHDAVVEWRIQLERVLTRSIAAQLDPPSRYRAAVRLVRRFERDVSGLTSRLPQLCPYTLEQILSGGR